MKFQIVMLSGKQGSGKSTLAQKLIERFNGKKHSQGVEVRFAKVIYDIHDMALDILRDCGIPNVPQKDGELLQLLGTDWGRKKYGENVWVQTTKGLVDRNHIAYPKYFNENFHLVQIISDCRFKNEFDGFPEALRVRLMCSDTVRKSRCHAWRDAINHPSEIDLDGYSAEKKFDLYLDTENQSIAGCVDLICAQLDKNNWIEKRKK